MIDIYDSEAIIKVYRLLNKKCDAIDKFIHNHALYFGPCTDDYGAVDVCNNIIELMERKNQLINLKIIVDDAIKRLNIQDKKVLYIKMNYKISMAELCGVLSLKERTAFRRIERAYENLAEALNKSKYISKLDRLLREEDWLNSVRYEVRERKMSYKGKENLC